MCQSWYRQRYIQSHLGHTPTYLLLQSMYVIPSRMNCQLYRYSVMGVGNTLTVPYFMNYETILLEPSCREVSVSPRRYRITSTYQGRYRSVHQKICSLSGIVSFCISCLTASVSAHNSTSVINQTNQHNELPLCRPDSFDREPPRLRWLHRFFLLEAIYHFSQVS